MREETFSFSERLNELDEHLSRFLPAMLLGLAKSKDKTEMLRTVDIWLEKNIHLATITRFLAAKPDFDGDRAHRALNVAIQHRNSRAVLDILEIALRRFSADKPRTKSLFAEAVKFFSETKDASWLDEAWIYFRKDGLIDELDERGVESLLENLVFRPAVNYHDEELLKILATTAPDKVIDLFGRRLLHDETLRGNRSETDDDVVDEDRYEPIPFSFGDLKSALKPYPRLILDKAGLACKNIGTV